MNDKDRAALKEMLELYGPEVVIATIADIVDQARRFNNADSDQLMFWLEDMAAQENN